MTKTKSKKRPVLDYTSDELAHEAVILAGYRLNTELSWFIEAVERIGVQRFWTLLKEWEAE